VLGVSALVRRFLVASTCGILIAALAGSCAAPSGRRATSADAARMERIETVVVIYAENHSFDNMYGLFPGANGISRATPEQTTQLDHDGAPLSELIVFGPDGKPDPRFSRMPNRPFRIDAPPVSRPPTTIVPSPIHAFFHNQEQINGGRNNMFAAMSTVGGWTMGYYDGSSFRLVGPSGERARASVRLPGIFNVSNAVAALVGLVVAGVPLPAGRVRIYEADPSGDRQLIGETAEYGRQRLVGDNRIGPHGITADRGNHHAAQHGEQRERRNEGHVRMPLARPGVLAVDVEDRFRAGDRRDGRVGNERAQESCEALMPGFVEMALAAEKYDPMAQQGIANRGHRFVRQVAG